ncbi:MAG TPA: methylated-DNA--[protein]-cysteine S-methyltransferase [Candidatus Binataceae bacterium]|nr:methylated-DNA--[protein]-cysteine S-methyltransferase [Candidatus Binataceae bacterium]
MNIKMTATIDSTLGILRRRADGATELRINGSSYGAYGKGARMGFTIASAADFPMLLAATANGISWLGIHASPAYLESELRRDYPNAEIHRDDRWVSDFAARVIAELADESSALELPLDIRATPFQLAVWRELCAIPRGATRSYGEIARLIGSPDAARAVGHANGSNPTSIIIPCHRAIGADGSLTGYRWGVEIKRRLLEREGALDRASPFAELAGFGGFAYNRGRKTGDGRSLYENRSRLYAMRKQRPMHAGGARTFPGGRR